MSELLIVSAIHTTDYILAITFNDGHRLMIDFAPFIFSVEHPDYDVYKENKSFLNYKIEDGNLNWDDYTMIFPIEDLYLNKIMVPMALNKRSR